MNHHLFSFFLFLLYLDVIGVIGVYCKLVALNFFSPVFAYATLSARVNLIIKMCTHRTVLNTLGIFVDVVVYYVCVNELVSALKMCVCITSNRFFFFRWTLTRPINFSSHRKYVRTFLSSILALSFHISNLVYKKKTWIIKFNEKKPLSNHSFFFSVHFFHFWTYIYLLLLT